MPVEKFTDGLDPDDLQAVIWRFMPFWKFRDFVGTRTLYFNRADLFPEDDREGLPPEEYMHVLGLDPLDVQARNHHIATIAQHREGFYVSCWYLFDEEKPSIWKLYGNDGVAICSRYDLLKSAMDSFEGRPHLGLVRYGSAHLTGWNTQRFITTKRMNFAADREVRALLWIPDPFAGINRHFDDSNRAYERPLTPLPERVPDFQRRPVDPSQLLTGIRVSPYADPSTLTEVSHLVAHGGFSIPVLDSDLTRYKKFLP